MDSIEISSTGGAATHQAASLGTYVKTDQLAQGYPVYKKDAEGENYFLFVDPYGDWIVNQDLQFPTWGILLKNSVTKPTPKLPPRNDWFYQLSNEYLEDNTIEVVAKVGGQQSGNTPMERFLIKCGLDKYVASFSKLGITMDALREVHRGIAYYPDREEQSNIFKELDVSLEESLIMRKMMQEEQDNACEEKDLNPIADLSDENLPEFPYNVATVNHGKPVTAVTFFGDNGYLFTGGVGGTVRLWNTDPTVIPPFTCPGTIGGDPGFRIPPPFSVSRHSRKFYTPIIEFSVGGSDSVFLQNQTDDENVITCMKPVIGQMSGLLVGGLFQGQKSIQYIIFNDKFPPTNQAFAEMGYYKRKCLDMAFPESWNNKFAYCCHSTYQDVLKEDSNVEIWDIMEGERVGLLQGHEAGVTFINISKDETKLWTGGEDNTVRLWDLETKTQLQKYDLGHSVTGLTCSPKEDLAVASTGESNVSVMRAGSSDIEKIDYEPTFPDRLVFSPSGSWFLSLGSGVSGCAAPTGPKLFTFHTEKRTGYQISDKQKVGATCGAFHPEGTFIALGTTNETAEDKYRVEILNCSEKVVVSGYDSDSD